MMSELEQEIRARHFVLHVENWQRQGADVFEHGEVKYRIALVDVAQLQACELPHRLTYDVCGL